MDMQGAVYAKFLPQLVKDKKVSIKQIDAAVRRVVTKVARDTSRGPTLDLVHMLRAEDDGAEAASLAVRLGEKEPDMQRILRFLANTGTAERFYPDVVAGLQSKPRWRLTKRMAALYAEVYGG